MRVLYITSFIPKKNAEQELMLVLILLRILSKV